MKDFKITLIGCGKMASALAIGFYKKYPNLKFFGFNRTPEKSIELMKKINGKSVLNPNELPFSDIYLIGVKPQQFEDLAKMISLPSHSLVISMMAGISEERISEKLNVQKVIRVMPNSPCLVGAGVTSIFFNEKISKEENKLVKEIFQSVGVVIELPLEEQIAISTVFSGSGPGFLFELARIWYQKILEEGINPEIAKKMIDQTFLGSGKLMKMSNESYEELKDNVTSKGGTTEAGLKVLKESGFERLIMASLEESIKRCRNLSTGGN